MGLGLGFALGVGVMHRRMTVVIEQRQVEPDALQPAAHVAALGDVLARVRVRVRVRVRDRVRVRVRVRVRC